MPACSRRFCLFLLPICVSPLLAGAQTSAGIVAAKPPAAAVEPVSTDYFGTKISDPYRWMEGGKSDARFMTFLHSQNDYTQSVLASINGRDAILARIHQLNNAVPGVGGWQRAGGKIFYLQSNPGASAASLLVSGGKAGTRTLLDPVSLEQHQSHAAINYFPPSWDGRYVIVGVSLGGSEDATIHVVETASGRLLPDAISRTQYAWP